MDFTLMAKYNTQAVVFLLPPCCVSGRHSGYWRAASGLRRIVFPAAAARFPPVVFGTALLLLWLRWAPLRKHH